MLTNQDMTENRNFRLSPPNRSKPFDALAEIEAAIIEGRDKNLHLLKAEANLLILQVLRELLIRTDPTTVTVPMTICNCDPDTHK